MNNQNDIVKDFINNAENFGMKINDVAETARLWSDAIKDTGEKTKKAIGEMEKDLKYILANNKICIGFVYQDVNDKYEIVMNDSNDKEFEKPYDFNKGIEILDTSENLVATLDIKKKLIDLIRSIN